jgi:hypothetical protein
LLFSRSRLTRRGSRRPLSAVLALVYFWAFVALGLTHTHAPILASTYHRSARAAATSPPNGMIVAPAVAADDDTPCAVCAAVHAATVALVHPPAVTHIPAAATLLIARSASRTPTSNPSVLHLRGPPAS